MNEEILVLPWKGKSGYEVTKAGDSYDVVEYAKGKEDREPKKIVHTITKESVDVMQKLITDHCIVGEQYGYRYLIRLVIKHYDICEEEIVCEDVMLDLFNGGKMRAAYYFPLYYYPLKILESLGVVHYWGRGGITLLKQEVLI